MKNYSFLRFVTVLTAALALLFIVGITFGELSLATFLFYLSKLAIKAMTAAALGIALCWLNFRFVLDTPLSQLKSKLRTARNNSYAILGSTQLFGLPVGILVFAGGQSLSDFIFAVMVKGSIGLAIGFFVTLIVAKVFGISSLDQFKDWIQTEDNDNYAILVTSIYLATVILAVATA